MRKRTHEVRDDAKALAADARALMAATANVAEEQVVAARQRLAAALKRGRGIYGRVHDRAVTGAKATDQAVHEHPYRAMGIALGLGALIGDLVARRCSRNGA